MLHQATRSTHTAGSWVSSRRSGRVFVVVAVVIVVVVVVVVVAIVVRVVLIVVVVFVDVAVVVVVVIFSSSGGQVAQYTADRALRASQCSPAVPSVGSR